MHWRLAPSADAEFGSESSIPPLRDRIDWDAEPLGRVVDRELAEKDGVTRSAVQTQRKRRGILAFTKRRK